MPRIYTNNPYDFCKRCFPTHSKTEQQYSSVGEGPDGRGNCYDYGADHHCYSGENYRCCVCKKPLKEDDNYLQVQNNTERNQALLKECKALHKRTTNYTELSNLIFDPIYSILTKVLLTKQERDEFVKSTEYQQISELVESRYENWVRQKLGNRSSL